MRRAFAAVDKSIFWVTCYLVTWVLCEDEDAADTEVFWLSKETKLFLVAILSCLAAVLAVLLLFCLLLCICNCTGGSAMTQLPAKKADMGQSLGPYSSQDRKLAHSAQMYHYQHQKQQMMALEKEKSFRKSHSSDTDSEVHHHEDDANIYECPGLAHTADMEIHNPMFREEADETCSQNRAISRPNAAAAGNADLELNTEPHHT